MNILITGTSRGIGREFVEQWLKKGQRVWAVSTHPDALKALAEQYPNQLTLVSTSVTNDACRSVIQEAFRSEPLDLLINNAGAYPEEPDHFEEIPIAMLQKGFEVNTYAAFRVTQACVPALKRAAHARVVHITSLMGSIGDNSGGGSYAYRMSKAALNMFNKCFSIEFPQFTSVVVHPGWVKTEMGGTSAPTAPSESVSGMIRVIEGLKKSDTGKFFDFEGDELPW